MIVSKSGGTGGELALLLLDLRQADCGRSVDPSPAALCMHFVLGCFISSLFLSLCLNRLAGPVYAPPLLSVPERTALAQEKCNDTNTSTLRTRARARLKGRRKKRLGRNATAQLPLSREARDSGKPAVLWVSGARFHLCRHVLACFFSPKKHGARKQVGPIYAAPSRD